MYDKLYDLRKLWTEHDEIIVESKNGSVDRKTYSFVLPNTSALTYGVGAMVCAITLVFPTDFTSMYQIKICYDTIDDAYISATCALAKSKDAEDLYELLKKRLHLDGLERPIGLMGVDCNNRFNHKDFETWINTILEENGFQSKAYAFFDYN